jgi:CHAT domain-containing protein
MTVVDYALIGDTLLAWTLHDRGVKLRQSTLDRSRLARITAQTVSALEVGAEAQATRANLEQLFDWLIKPIAEEIGAAGTRIVVVADGEVNAVPFPALIDRANGHYLIEDHIIRSAASVRAIARADGGRHVRQPTDRVTFLAVNPAFDGSRHPELAQLDGAAAEVDSLTGMYPAASKLAGPAADRSALLAGLSDANVVHYAGHAILDDERPERSSLVLAPSHSARDSDVLRADELAGLDLSNVRLVVLSACQTLGSRAGHTRGLAGLADAFVTAGVGGVVGSQWRIDDRLTLELMTRFHRSYRTMNDPAAALQQAQRDMITSTSTALRSPSAWAGFRYVGH